MRAGDVVRVDFGVPRGGTPAAIRPAVIVTDDVLLSYGLLAAHVVPCTSTARGWESEIDSPWGAIQCHNVTTVSVDDIVNTTNENVGPVVLAQIRQLIADVLGIDG